MKVNKKKEIILWLFLIALSLEPFVIVSVGYNDDGGQESESGISCGNAEGNSGINGNSTNTDNGHEIVDGENYKDETPIEKESNEDTSDKDLGNIRAEEPVDHNFSNKSVVDVSSDSNGNLTISDREGTNSSKGENKIIINDEETPISLQIDVKENVSDFGLPTFPETMEIENYDVSQATSIIRIIANDSVKKITFLFIKGYANNLEKEQGYSLGMFEEGQVSWVLVPTTKEENEDASEIYLVGSLTDIEANRAYFVTIFKIQKTERVDLTWIFILIIGIIGVLVPLTVALSKKEYFELIMRRATYIEKGAHRLSLEQVLENEHRKKIVEIILNEQGIHFNELLRKISLVSSNLKWHLNILETYKIIRKKKVGYYVVYYPYFHQNSSSEIYFLVRKSKLTWKILKMIEQEDGLWNGIISRRLGVDHKTVHYHLQKLMNFNLIIVVKEGRKKRLYLNPDSLNYEELYIKGD